jgi:putative membrane protein
MTIKQRGYGSIAALAAVASIGWACSRQTDGYGPPQVGGVISAMDTKELQEAQIAQNKASAPSVKSFADRVVADLTTTRAGVQRVLQEQNIQPVVTRASQDIEADAHKSVSDLQAKSGGDFDKAYIEQEVSDKKNALDKLDRELIPNARNPQLKDYLQTNVRPTIESHLQMAERLKDDLESHQLTLADPQVAGVMAAIDNSEIEAGMAAQKKGVSQEVRSYAQHMVTQHSQLKNELNSLLQKQGISMATSPDSNQLSLEARTTTDKLNAKSGPEFDNAYIDAQLADHKKAIETIDAKLVPVTKNPELLNFIKNRVRPGIEKHLKMAEQTQATLNAKQGTDKQGADQPDAGPQGSGTEGSGTQGSGTQGSGTQGSGTQGSGTQGSGTQGSGTQGQGTRGSGSGAHHDAGVQGQGTQGTQSPRP